MTTIKEISADLTAIAKLLERDLSTYKAKSPAISPDDLNRPINWFTISKIPTPSYMGIKDFAEFESLVSDFQSKPFSASINTLVHDKESPGTFTGMPIQIIESWETGLRWERCIAPRRPPRGQRKGTKRQWKKAHPHGWRWRLGCVEPKSVLHIDGKVFMTTKQYETLIKKIQLNSAYGHP